MCSHVTVMGVSGSGKSAVGTRLAAELRFDFIEGDDLHPPANVEKMAAGLPLTDEDRGPWLRSLADVIAERHGRETSTVLACSALRRVYRDALRSALPAQECLFIVLGADEVTLRARLTQRRGHYMPPSLLGSQLATYESLQRDEPGVSIDATRPLAEVVADAVAATRSAMAGGHGTLPPGR
jgi:carbohydrate kinase (thermoresistant glucokinase family)